jgi:hypothetical protein
MQDRYVADVGDFGKYGLLRHLSNNLTLGVVWYLVPDEVHNSDGQHIRYLNLDSDSCRRYDGAPCSDAQGRRNAQRFRACDPELYDGLRTLVAVGERNVVAVAACSVLPSTTTFVNDVVTIDRDCWLATALRRTRHCDLVFLDPDNGLEIPSRSRASHLARKYAFYEDVRAF